MNHKEKKIYEDKLQLHSRNKTNISKDGWIYKLFKYHYAYYVQGTKETAEEYALLYVPANATFNNNRSTLIKKKYKDYYHEIDIDSVQDLTTSF